MQHAAKTPRSNCVMSSEKLRRAGIVLTEVHDAIERDLRNWTTWPPSLSLSGQRTSSNLIYDLHGLRNWRGAKEIE